MFETPVYLDNQATTRVDPRVVDAMLPFFTEVYGNAGSATHAFGWAAKKHVDQSREQIAAAIGCRPKELVFTNGATESNNLALRGVAEKYAGKGRHLVSVTTEHRSVLDPLEKLADRGFEVTLLPVVAEPDDQAGLLAAEQVAEAIRDDTILVSVMLANNEIGAIQPLAAIGQVCRERGVLLHCDATQAVGKLPVDVDRLGVDLMSFSAHKIYGPKGIGALYVRRRGRRVRLASQIDGGGQEFGLRSGTLNVPGIVGFARALELCLDEMPEEALRVSALRDRLFQGLLATLPEVELNGPALDPPQHRLPGNLNVRFDRVDGQTLLATTTDLALSSGSACSSAESGPSHVLRALGLSEEAARSSVRFGIGRFNTEEEIDFAVDVIAEAVKRLRSLGSPV